MADQPRVRAVADACTAAYGRPRKLSLQSVLAIGYLHALSRPTHMTVTGMLRTLDQLSDSERRHLGVPAHLHVRHKHVWGGLRRLAQHIRDGLQLPGEHHHEPSEPCTTACQQAVALTEDDISTILVQASLPSTFPRTGAVDVDGTDIESHAVMHWRPDHSGWTCTDHELGGGHRTPTDRRPNPFFAGYEGHLATYVLPAGVKGEIPLLFAGLALRPGVQDRAGACVRLVGALTAFGPIHEVIYDRGYSTSKPEKLAAVLREMGVTATFDLHTSQRGIKAGPKPGTIWCDGTLYSTALPEALRNLEPPAITMTAEQKARIRDVFDARAPYAFVPHSKPVPGRHARRFKGPALAGHVRCPNWPKSMRLGPEIPTTNCVPGSDCGCGKTVSVPDTMNERDRQPLAWQSNAWAKSYNRRTRIEGCQRADPVPRPQRQPRLLPHARPHCHRTAPRPDPRREQRPPPAPLVPRPRQTRTLGRRTRRTRLRRTPAPLHQNPWTT
ncbi:hypothetical protein [Luteimicrobium album]|nr:hypothetical protein [Luteimicrobium album]